MQFLYLEASGTRSLTLEDEPFRYLVKVRRVKSGSVVETRNLRDHMLYSYKITEIGRRNATLELVDKKELIIPGGNLHIGWCVIDPKVIEKTLPMLNQAGVKKITFFPCDFSQKNFKLSLERMEKILISSCEQCGRSELMELGFGDSLHDFLKTHPKCAILDFNPNTTFDAQPIDTILIGCEGGFSDKERQLFADHPVVSFGTGLILRSETAAVSAASKILL